MKKNIAIIIGIMLITNIASAFTIYSTTSTWTINDDCVLYVTYFFSDNDTPGNMNDDKILGVDSILKCRDGNTNLVCHDIILNKYLEIGFSKDYSKRLGIDKPITYGKFTGNKNRLIDEASKLGTIKIEKKEEIKTVRTIKTN